MFVAFLGRWVHDEELKEKKRGRRVSCGDEVESEESKEISADGVVGQRNVVRSRRNL